MSTRPRTNTTDGSQYGVCIMKDGTVCRRMGYYRTSARRDFVPLPILFSSEIPCSLPRLPLRGRAREHLLGNCMGRATRHSGLFDLRARPLP